MTTAAENVLIGVGVVGLGVVGATVLSSTFTVETGEVGVVYKFGQITKVSEPGLNFKTPFVTKVVDVSTQNQVYNSQPLNSGLKGKQVVIVDTSIDYKIVDPTTYLTNYNPETFNSIINRVQQEVVKETTLNFTLDEAIGERRGELSTAIQTGIVNKLAGLPIGNVTVTVEDISPSEQIRAAIERTTVAQQDAKTAEQNKVKAEQEAQAKVIAAKGEAEANSVLAKSLNVDGDLVIEMKQLEVQEAAINKWNGVLPTTNAGESVPFLSVN